MKFISLFAGIGGFDLALNRLGHECVYANEWDKYAASIYDRNFKTKIDQRDIRTVSTEELPDFDLLVGGFPCQTFSVAGKRMGFNDTRGTLFFEIARILREKRPRLFILENVKGLLSHDNGNTFKTIITTLDELGYDIQWQVLNSKNFGVPQNRERVFIIGHLRGTSRPQVFPVTEADGNHIIQINNPKHSHNRIFDISGISPTLNTMQGGLRQPKISYAIDASYWKGGSLKDYLEKHRRQLIFTPQIRRLTPLECERLQGFPDGWTEGVSDTQRYKCLGNAVTVNVIQHIASKLCQD